MSRLTEKKKIDIDHECVDNPVYLNWLGTNGGRNYWLFKRVQTRSLQVSVGGTYEPYQKDIEHSQGFIQDVSRDANPRLTIGARVPVNKLQGIERMLYSLNVLMLMNPKTWQTDTGGCRWQIVRPVPGSFKLNDTDEKFTNIEVILELPFINIQSL